MGFGGCVEEWVLGVLGKVEFESECGVWGIWEEGWGFGWV